MLKGSPLGAEPVCFAVFPRRFLEFAEGVVRLPLLEVLGAPRWWHPPGRVVATSSASATAFSKDMRNPQGWSGRDLALRRPRASLLSDRRVPEPASR